MDNDFVHTDVPSIVQLGEHQYDLAVRQRALGKFEYVTSHLKVEPFGDYDGLSTRHGKASAADLAVKTYEAELRRGVPEDQIPWYNNQISWYKDQNSRYQDRVSSPTS
ncbi:hypothetical protein AJ80_09883 [Polytolypa hystricis UAMH7299]|uniref:Uncharacterized protein n=1 Tax=Polytolypa hystricis (strain UAMH7299) TaxID=1447883 RepID=A0A2B7WHJ0_POLH7|nr:hypothetical protein AJ80_09883 [Polytolypa hystricis UAMH7299]